MPINASGDVNDIDTGEIADVEREIRSRGWEQGSLIEIDPQTLWVAIWANDDRSLLRGVSRPSQRSTRSFIIVTQTCDLIQSLSKEPYVEVSPVLHEPSKSVRATYQRSARWFEIDPMSDLVVSNAEKYLIDKRFLTTCLPEAWPGNKEQFRQFKLWLGRRYVKAAFAEAINNGFIVPLSRKIRELRKMEPTEYERFNNLVEELRLEIIDRPEPPIAIVIHGLLPRPALSIADSDLLDRITESMYQIADTVQVEVSDVEFLTRQRMSVATYLNSERINFDDESLSRGGESIGASSPVIP